MLKSLFEQKLLSIWFNQTRVEVIQAQFRTIIGTQAMTKDREMSTGWNTENTNTQKAIQKSLMDSEV